MRIFYEVYGSDGPAVFLLPTWSIIHSRHWKLQIPYLARHFRVLTFDGRGSGRSDHVRVILIGFSDHTDMAAQFSGQCDDISFDLRQYVPR